MIVSSAFLRKTPNHGKFLSTSTIFIFTCRINRIYLKIWWYRKYLIPRSACIGVAVSTYRMNYVFKQLMNLSTIAFSYQSGITIVAVEAWWRHFRVMSQRNGVIQAHFYGLSRHPWIRIALRVLACGRDPCWSKVSFKVRSATEMLHEVGPIIEQ